MQRRSFYLSIVNTRLFWGIFLASCTKPLPPTGVVEPAFMLPATVGGTAGQIIKVTSLETSGPGSLREALLREGSRIIVFEVGGIIDLDETDLIITEPYVTIAGQTAPSPGITLIRGSIIVYTHDVLIRHIRIRPGDAGMPRKSGWEPDGISVNGPGAINVVIDHCSITWAIDENLSASGPQYEGRSGTAQNITFSHNIVAEALSNASHTEGEHSKGSLIFDNIGRIAIIRNLYACNADRNPCFKTGSYGAVINNLIYNPSIQAIALDYDISEYEDFPQVPDPPRVSICGNVLLSGKDTPFYLSLVSGTGEAYLEDNLALKRNGGSRDLVKNSVTLVNKAPAVIEDLEIMPSGIVEEYILNHAGARPWDRDMVDERIINAVREDKGRIIDTQDDVGGYPDYSLTFRELNLPEKDTLEWLNSFENSENKGSY